MKLTKAQRLFMKAGRMETMINGLAYKIQTYPLSAAITVPKGALKRMRRERKRLIREALEAWEAEGAAEAERDRLNAEHRKEQRNG